MKSSQLKVDFFGGGVKAYSLFDAIEQYGKDIDFIVCSSRYEKEIQNIL